MREGAGLALTRTRFIRKEPRPLASSRWIGALAFRRQRSTALQTARKPKSRRRRTSATGRRPCKPPCQALPPPHKRLDVKTDTGIAVSGDAKRQGDQLLGLLVERAITARRLRQRRKALQGVGNVLAEFFQIGGNLAGEIGVILWHGRPGSRAGGVFTTPHLPQAHLTQINRSGLRPT